MSRTTDVLIKAKDSPNSLTPAERAFCGLDGPRDLHAEAIAGGHPCDCRACAPELWRQDTLFPVAPQANSGAYGPAGAATSKSPRGTAR